MADLPDELWRIILEIGVSTSVLSHKDLCCVSIASTRLRRLSADPSLWSCLIARDFSSSSSCPSSTNSVPSKALYKTKFERDKARKLAAWRLAVLNVQSQIAICSKNLDNFRALLSQEHKRWKSAAAELANLENVRLTSVALSVWQPEVIRNSHRKTVEQCTVPIDSRIKALQMEIKLCKQQVTIYDKSHKDQKEKLDERKEALTSLKYHPVHNFLFENAVDYTNRTRKRLKQSTECNLVENKRLNNANRRLKHHPCMA